MQEIGELTREKKTITYYIFTDNDNFNVNK